MLIVNLKKRLLVLLSAFSCLPISNAAENKSNLVQDKEKSDAVAHNKDNVNVVKKASTQVPTIKSKINEEKKGLSIGQAASFTLLGTTLGVGGTLLAKKLMNRSNVITPKVESFLYDCAKFSSCNYDEKKEYDRDPARLSYDYFLAYSYNGCARANQSKEIATLFKALSELYTKIIESKEFKSLNIKEPENKILESIYDDVILIPKSVKQGTKWTLKSPELKPDHVYASMKKGSEIKTTGSIDGDGGNYVEYSVTFARDNEGNITLKDDFKIEKT